MFTKLNIAQRIQIGLVLAIAFLLVLGSNRLDQRHFSTIQTTVNSVYKDRVVVQNFIYQLTTIFHKKELRLISNENPKSVEGENEKVEQLLMDFGATQLTPKESNLFEELKGQFNTLLELEKTFVKTPLEMPSVVLNETRKELNAIKESLGGLANIQLEESGQLVHLSNKSLGMNILLSKLEIAFMVVIGIAMLALIFYPMNAYNVFENNSSQN